MLGAFGKTVTRTELNEYVHIPCHSFLQLNMFNCRHAANHCAEHTWRGLDTIASMPFEKATNNTV